MAIFAISRLISAANSAGVPGEISKPSGKLVAHTGGAQNLHETPVDLLDNRRGREEAGPGRVIESGDAGFRGWAEWDTFEAYFGEIFARVAQFAKTFSATARR